MIPISDELKQAFLSTSRYEVEGYFGGLTKIIDNSNILTGGFSLARDLISGNSIEIGTAISAELSINLSNIDHSFEESLPEWLREDFKPGMTIEFRIKPFGSTESIKLGTFVVDKLEYKRNYITLSALDKMVYLDRIADPAITFVTNLSLLVSNICRLSGVTLANSDEISTFANATVPFPLYTIKAEQGTTYRQLLIYACQLMGVYAYMDWNGELRLSQIPAISSSGVSITKANRVSSDFGASEIALTGIEYVSGDNTEYFSGTTGYVLSMSDNSILEWLSDSLRTTMVNNLATRISSLSGLQYLPFSASIIGQPWLMPGDRVKLVDYNGVTRDSFITNMSYRLNGTMTLEAKGTNEETYTLATTGAFTPAQQTVVKRLSIDADKEIVVGGVTTPTITATSEANLPTTVNVGDKTLKKYIEDIAGGYVPALHDFSATLPAGSTSVSYTLPTGASPKSICAIANGEMVIIDVGCSGGKLTFQIAEALAYDISIKGELIV